MPANNRKPGKPKPAQREPADIALVPTNYHLRGRTIQVYVALQRLGALSAYVPVNLSQLARDEGMHRNTVRAALARLEVKQLARRDSARRAYWRVFTTPESETSQ